VSAFVVCFRLPLPALGFWGFLRYWVVVGGRLGGSSEDFGEIVEQFRLELQLCFEATRQIRDTVGSGKAEPPGEVGQSDLCVAAAQPGGDRPRYVRVVTLCKQGGFHLVKIHHGSEDPFRV
jgi:hypothetical protein